MSLKQFILFTTLLIGPTGAQDRNSFDGLIINENAILGLCGEMNFVRQRRDCLNPNVTDLKHCLKLDSSDPLFKVNDRAMYNCVNSSSTGGAEVIRSLLENSEMKQSCLAEDVRFFYEQLIESSEFRELSREYENNLGSPLVLNFAIDTRDSISSLQLDLSELNIPGIKKEPINLSISAFSQKAPCQRISREAIFNRVAEELARLTMVSSQRDLNLLEQDDFQKPGDQVFDAGRFSNQEDSDLSDQPEIPPKETSASIR
ncbi:MAG: hypothetical protein K9K67_04145 [Bacteriovoracaceae bacterium]|nr:hypothetical protein [Bacteriovoracaceae bacterium]